MNKALYFNINYMLYKKYLYFPKQQKLRVRSVLAYNLQFFLMETAEFSYLLLHSFCFNTRLCDFWKTPLFTREKLRAKATNGISALL